MGSHTCTHPERMSHLSDRELVRQWKDSCAVLQDIVGAAVRTASVAGGYYSRSVAADDTVAGIEVLFNSEPTAKASVAEGCLVLGRYSIQSFSTPSVTGEIAAGECWPWWKPSLLWSAKKIVKTAGGESYGTLRRHLLRRFVSRQKNRSPIEFFRDSSSPCRFFPLVLKCERNSSTSSSRGSGLALFRHPCHCTTALKPVGGFGADDVPPPGPYCSAPTSHDPEFGYGKPA